MTTGQQTTRGVIRRIVNRLWFAPDNQALVLDTGDQLSILKVPGIENGRTVMSPPLSNARDESPRVALHSTAVDPRWMINPRTRRRCLPGPLATVAAWTAVVALLGAVPASADDHIAPHGFGHSQTLPLSGSASAIDRALAVESEFAPFSEAMTSKWNQVIRDASQAIAKLPRSDNHGWNRRYAESVLKSIDATLTRHGFLYPATGAVDLVAHALTPFQMAPDQRPAFESQPQNQRRRDVIEERFPGPFFLLDCDTAGALYLAVAHRLDLPLCLVLVPSHNLRAGHAFVRWREGKHFLNWETNEGRVLSNDDYVRAWGIRRPETVTGAALADLSVDQTVACGHQRIAVQYERLHDFHNALRHLAIARHLFPQNLDVRRQLAWLAATTADQTERTPSEVIDDARYVVGISDDSDARDTLAAALAAAGQFKEAIRQEKAAIRASADAREARIGYQARLRLYERHQTFQRPASTPAR